MSGGVNLPRQQAVVNFIDMQAEILYMDSLDVGATLVSPTVAEADFGRSKDRPYNSAQASLISIIHHLPAASIIAKPISLG